MAQRLLPAAAIGLALLVLGLALFWHPELPQGTASENRLLPGGDFTLQSNDGPVSLKDYRGKVVLLNFGYTSCPDICPTSLAATAAGLQPLKPEEVDRVALLFVSLDPERDTTSRLKEYAAFFHPKLVGATGSPVEVAAMARQYGVYYAKQKTGTASGYVIDHSSDTYVIGTDGRLAGRIPYATPPEQVAAEIRKQLNPR